MAARPARFICKRVSPPGRRITRTKDTAGIGSGFGVVTLSVMRLDSANGIPPPGAITRQVMWPVRVEQDDARAV